MRTVKDCWLDGECCLLGASPTPSYTIRRPPYPTSSRCLPTGEPRKHAPCRSGEIANRVNPHGPVQPRGRMKLWFATKMGKNKGRSPYRRTFLGLGLGNYAHLFETRHAGVVPGFAYRDPRGLCLFRLIVPRVKRFKGVD